MLGAIIGDIVGAVYEWHNIKTKEFPLFRDDCFFTDDTVMTIVMFMIFEILRQMR
jgi:ADP-ribosylglycohydrolase